MNRKTISTIKACEAKSLLDQAGDTCVLLDVRTPAEFSSLHAEKAVNLPLQSLSAGSVESLKGKKIICICQKGARGAQAAEIFLKNGFDHVYNIEGGTNAWESSDLPVVQGKPTISLERQVRIAAGTLVTIGIIGGYLLTPYLLLLSLFVGCGLVFSGVTDTCGMGLLLARCPWNQRQAAPRPLSA